MRSIWKLIPCLLLGIDASSMAAPAFDAVTAKSSTSSPQTVVFTVSASGTLGLAGLTSTEDISAVAITWNGTAMSLVRAEVRSFAESHFYQLGSPATGSVTVIGSWTGGGARNTNLWAMSFTNSDAAVLGSAGNNAASSAIAVTITTTRNSSLVVDAVASFPTVNTLEVNCGQTRRWREIADASHDGGAGSTEAQGVAPVTVDSCWTQVTAPNWAIVAAEVGAPIFTATPTWTPTFTWTPTATPTFTWTATATPTYTWTPTSTWTSTWTPTRTPTWTRTATRTFTLTPTAVGTPVPVLFVSNRPGLSTEGQMISINQIWRTDTAGATPVQITKDPYPKKKPQWADNGTRIVYCSEANGTWDIWIMWADGTGSVKIGSSLFEECADDGTP